MSEESYHSEHPGGWIEWFCSHEDHLYLCEIDEDFVKDPTNSFDFRNNYPLFEQAIHMILQPEMPDAGELQDPQFLEVYQEAIEIYGLLHSKYIQTPIGLAIMRERVLQGRFGHCPRIYCEKQHVIPVGLSEDPKTARVKIFCPRCEDAYAPMKKCTDLDGAYFGKSFPALLLVTYPDLVPQRGNVRDPDYKKFESTLFGFRIHGKGTSKALTQSNQLVQQQTQFTLDQNMNKENIVSGQTETTQVENQKSTTTNEKQAPSKKKKSRKAN